MRPDPPVAALATCGASPEIHAPGQEGGGSPLGDAARNGQLDASRRRTSTGVVSVHWCHAGEIDVKPGVSPVLLAPGYVNDIDDQIPPPASGRWKTVDDSLAQRRLAVENGLDTRGPAT